MKKAIAMKCSQKDWDSIKGRIKLPIKLNSDDFDKYCWITNDRNKEGVVANLTSHNNLGYNREIHETFNAKIFLNACGIDCDVYEITKEQVLELAQHTHLAKNWFPDVFKKELEVGKWYKNLDKGYEKSICCVIEVNKEDKDLFSGYGIDYVGEYFYEPIDTTFCGSNNWQEATTQEVEAALICEARKRGFDKDACCNNSEIHGYKICNAQLEKGYFKFKKGCLNWYESNGGWYCVFKDGKWAQIIETITIQEAEKLLNKKIV